MKCIRVKDLVPFLLFLCLATICTPTRIPPNQNQPSQRSDCKRHFVLVHGAGVGAWCWYKLATLLNSTGHNVTTLDMAASGINPKQVQQVNSFSDYVEPLIEFMESLPPKERVILVGHSFGGASISIAMERFPQKIYVAVFVTALMPGPDLNYSTVFNEVAGKLNFLDSIFRQDNETGHPQTSVLYGPKFVSSMFYQLSPPEDVTLAISLVRYFPIINEEIKLTKEKYGSVRRVFIVSRQDNTIKEDQQMWMIAKNPPDEVKVINGSDHMVMSSKPLELAFHLQEIAQK
ncbi:methyl jasmonate esterase 1-like [Pyrus communis]|uniref:methyl jasmonate esterase 1-like n=1 Tax=Pyrus communis TaxID=23211 RepID=UPI0035BF2C75